MEPLLCFPDPPPEELQKALDGKPAIPFVGRHDSAEAIARLEPEDGWAGAVISAVEDRSAGDSTSAERLRKRETPVSPLLLIIDRQPVGDARSTTKTSSTISRRSARHRQRSKPA